MVKKSNKHRQGPIKIFDLRVETPSSNDKNLAYDILNWGLKGGDNLYAVDALLAITNSPTASACMSTRGSYIRGGGFNIEELERIKVNNDEKFGELHTGLSETVNKLKGLAIHVKRNIGGEIVALNKMPFEDFRLQVPNENNQVTHVHYNPRWGQGDFKTSETIVYPLYTTDPIDYIKRLEEFRLKNPAKKYTGEVYWKFIKKDGFPYYPFPLSEIDLKVFQTDTSFAEFDFNNIENNFLLSFIMNVYGNPNDPIKEYYNTIVDGQEVSNERIIGTRGELFNEEMQANFGGAKNTGKGMVNWMQTESQKMDVSAFPNNTNSDLFKDTQSRIWNKIALITQVPNILANIETAGKMGGSQEKLESIQLLNDSVTIQQNLLEQAYNELLPKHVLFKNIVLDNEIVIKKKNPITFLPDQVWAIIPDAAKLKYVAENYNIDIEIEEQGGDNEIEEQKIVSRFAEFGVGGVQGILAIQTAVANGIADYNSGLATLQIIYGFQDANARKILGEDKSIVTNPDGTTAPAQAPATQTNENITNLTGRQQQNLDRIVRKFKKGDYTREQAMMMIKEGFGFTDDQAVLWLDDIDGNETTKINEEENGL